MNKLEISFDSIEKYTKISGNIDAIKISGYGRSNFAIGKFVLKKIGVINMFVTSSKNMFYLKTTGGNYGISPEKQETFEHMLKSKGIICNEWISEKATSVKIYKDNQFKIPFFFVSIIIIIIILLPLLLYINHKLPSAMPLSFDATFKPRIMGTNKEFVFRQMAYGAFNMMILLCMYFAAYINAKYIKKLAYVYIYISLIISVAFLFIQFRILAFFM